MLSIRKNFIDHFLSTDKERKREIDGFMFTILFQPFLPLNFLIVSLSSYLNIYVSILIGIFFLREVDAYKLFWVI